MKPEKQHLIADLLDEEQAVRREIILLAGGQILRRKRWRRITVRGFAVLAVLGVVAFSILRTSTPPAHIITQAPPVPDQPKALTDDELLALFPNTPVGLAKLENGNKKLIFPRAGDEEKFVTRL